VTPEQGSVPLRGGSSERPTLHQSLAYPDLGEFTEEPLPAFRVIDEASELFAFHFPAKTVRVVTGPKRPGALVPVDTEADVVAEPARGLSASNGGHSHCPPAVRSQGASRERSADTSKCPTSL
jgi:hypothetical protein